jgi:hypothetical protein
MRMGDSEWAQPVGELIQLSLSSDYFTEKLTNRPLPLSETMKAQVDTACYSIVHSPHSPCLASGCARRGSCRRGEGAKREGEAEGETKVRHR